MPEIPIVSIVDDDPSVRAAAHNLVRSLGYVVHTFPSAEAFLQSPQLNTTDCVIADIRMPGMSGLDMQERLRTQGRNVPIIFITALADSDVRTRALAGGACGFLSKPFDDEALVNCIGTAISR